MFSPSSSNPVVPAAELRTLDLGVLQDPSANAAKPCHFRGQSYPPGHPVDVSPCLDCGCDADGLVSVGYIYFFFVASRDIEKKILILVVDFFFFFL